MWSELSAQIIENLQKVGIGCGIFLLMYISNMSASIWYNVKILNERFDWNKIKASGIKVLCITIAIVCLCLGITLVLPWVDYVGLTIPDEFTKVLNIVAMCSIALAGIVKYGKEAFGKIQKIFNPTNEETTVNK